jgi:arylamine N-acetyltransferase
VQVDGDDWLVDAGFGSLTPTVPLRLHDPQPQATPHERYLLRRLPGDGDFVLSAESGDGWRAMYRFDLQAPAPIDNVVGNWYVCTHPDSSFPGQLRASLTGPDWRRTIGSGNYTEYRPARHRTSARCMMLATCARYCSSASACGCRTIHGWTRRSTTGCSVRAPRRCSGCTRSVG